ncbi:hypothetical protein HAX54_020409 [Datura stramonium]|uniref:B box-type domain-containing protein n=1 Tax=Datura stramonium TaxID=4076 RepID=A0ABS8UT26_DATST|nr:hypothetical protein [Datura stramonium]
MQQIGALNAKMEESSSFVIMRNVLKLITLHVWTCLVCEESPADFHCYCCKRAACERCIGEIDFVHLKGEYGFCNNCLKLALLVEEDRNIDSDGESVDLSDQRNI